MYCTDNVYDTDIIMIIITIVTIAPSPSSPP